MELLLDRLIGVVIALSTFQIKANPKADGADVLLAHAVPDAELVIAYDGKPLFTDNYPAFVKLPDHPLIAKYPATQALLREAVQAGEQVRVAMQQQLGGDPVAYLGSLAIMFVGLPVKEGDAPRILVACRIKGTKPEAALAGFAAQGGTESMIDGRRVVTSPGGMMTGIARDGSLVAGTEAWVRPRLADSWKAPVRPKGSPLAAIATALDARPFLTIASIPSPAIVARVRAEAGQGFASDLYAGHTVAVLSASSTGLAFTYQAHDAAFAGRFKLAAEGAIELLRALHLAPRSALQIAAAALPSYAGEHQVIDQLLASQKPLLDALGTMSGDGRFAAKVTVDGTTVTATARGKRFSDVVPTNLFVTGIAAALVFRDGKKEEASASPAPPPPPKPRPGTGGTPVKRPR